MKEYSGWKFEDVAELTPRQTDEILKVITVRQQNERAATIKANAQAARGKAEEINNMPTFTYTSAEEMAERKERLKNRKINDSISKEEAIKKLQGDANG